MLYRIPILSALACLLFSCSPKNKLDPDDGLQSFTVTGLEQHIATLASNDFQGRRPFTEGEKKTLAYLKEKFSELGLESGNDTSYLQEVPMVEITPSADSIMH